MKPKKPIPWRRRTGPYWVKNSRLWVKDGIGPREATVFKCPPAVVGEIGVEYVEWAPKPAKPA